MMLKVQENRKASTEAEIWESVKEAIEHAWLDTAIQIEERNYPPQVRRDYFYQFLNANTITRLYAIRNLHTGLAAEICPNQRNSAFHIKLRINGKTVTISAITVQDSHPRHADFRHNYATHQLEFDLNDDETILSIPPPPSPESLKDGSESRYYQILHGPKGRKSYELGFISVVGINIFGERTGPPISINEYITPAGDTEFTQQGESHPTIDIPEELTVTRRENAPCPAKQEVQDSLGTG